VKKPTEYNTPHDACWPDDEAKLIEAVDAAIESASQRLRDIYG
jgi:hypothetical protein